MAPAPIRGEVVAAGGKRDHLRWESLRQSARVHHGAAGGEQGNGGRARRAEQGGPAEDAAPAAERLLDEAPGQGREDVLQDKGPDHDELRRLARDRVPGEDH